MQSWMIKTDPYNRVTLIFRNRSTILSREMAPHVRQTTPKQGIPTKLTPIPSNHKHHGSAESSLTCASMTLPYWPKVRSSVRSVVSHDSPPTKMRPTFSSAIPGPNQSESPRRRRTNTCTVTHQPNRIRKPKSHTNPRRNRANRVARRRGERGGGSPRAET